MLTGTVTDDGIPIIQLFMAGQTWPAIIDTGFNGDLELPDSLRTAVNAQLIGRVSSLLGGAQQVEEDIYLVDFPFDGQVIRAEAAFVPGREILLGTQLLRLYRLEIHFPARTVVLEAVS